MVILLTILFVCFAVQTTEAADTSAARHPDVFLYQIREAYTTATPNERARLRQEVLDAIPELRVPLERATRREPSDRWPDIRTLARELGLPLSEGSPVVMTQGLTASEAPTLATPGPGAQSADASGHDPVCSATACESPTGARFRPAPKVAYN